MSTKDREISSLADKLESALQAAADATAAAAAASQGGGLMMGLRGTPTDNEVKRAIAQAQSQVCGGDGERGVLLISVGTDSA